MSAETLLPCPFCGGKAAVHRCEHAFHDAKARCAECGAEGPIFDVDDGEENEAGRNEEEAIAAWNRRTPPAPTEAVACQKCGGEVQGWTCQGCGQGFRENDGGVLIFDTHPPQPDAILSLIQSERGKN